jgi:dienelactone hydrolase
MLMLLGEKDDWTPPERCARLAERARRAHSDVELDLRLYADSYHGFDSAQPVRFRKGIPNGVNAEGVHSGGNPAAREAALREVDAFLAARLGGAQKAASALPPTIR